VGANPPGGGISGFRRATWGLAVPRKKRKTRAAKAAPAVKSSRAKKLLHVAVAGLLIAAVGAAAYFAFFYNGPPATTTPARVGTAGPAAGGGFMPMDQYADGLNLYEYAKGMPASASDPLGLFTEYECCTNKQKTKIMGDALRARTMIIILQNDIRKAIAADKGQYPAFTGAALQSALHVLDGAQTAIRDLKVKCELPGESRMCESGAAAWIKSVFARTVHLCPTVADSTMYSYWQYGPRNRAATLVHEGTHTRGTTDARYFDNHNERPHRVGLVQWHWIASTYDTWILYGFCIPGHDCPDSDYDATPTE
jgi:hypothetical protein